VSDQAVASAPFARKSLQGAKLSAFLQVEANGIPKMPT